MSASWSHAGRSCSWLQQVSYTGGEIEVDRVRTWVCILWNMKDIAHRIHKITQALLETWFFWLFFLVLGFMCGRETETRRVPPSADLVISLGFGFLVAFWVWLDARRCERKIGYGFPALVFLMWPVFAPIYLFQSRGVRGVLSLLKFVLMLCVVASIGVCIGLATL